MILKSKFFQQKKIFIYISCLFLAACENSPQEIAQFQALVEKERVEQADSVVLYYSDSAVVRIRVQAPKMLYYSDVRAPKRVFPQGVLVDFYDANHSPTSKLRAGYAEQGELTKEIILRDSVVVWNYRNEKLETEELICEEIKKRIYSDKFVKISTPTYTIFGKWLESNLEFTNWKIKDVSGTILTTENMDNPMNR